MPSPAKGPRLGGGPQHERLMLANLATALFEHGRITTTVTKARRLRPLAERLITFAKRGDLHARRRVLTIVRDKGVVHELFTEIGPRFENRPGGYTRITRIGSRKGDNAPMAVIELVEALGAKAGVVREAEAATGRSAKATGGGAVRTERPDDADADAALETAESAAEEAADSAAEGDVEGAEEAAGEARAAADAASRAAKDSSSPDVEEAAGTAEALAEIAEQAAEEVRKDES